MHGEWHLRALYSPLDGPDFEETHKLIAEKWSTILTAHTRTPANVPPITTACLLGMWHRGNGASFAPQHTNWLRLPPFLSCSSEHSRCRCVPIIRGSLASSNPGCLCTFPFLHIPCLYLLSSHFYLGSCLSERSSHYMFIYVIIFITNKKKVPQPYKGM